jgi:subtilisin-like proprotein convertase family protein
MPRYFFHFHDGTEQRDDTGTELASARDARSQAVVFMGERLQDLDGEFWPEGEWRIQVVDEAGATVCAIRVSGE